MKTLLSFTASVVLVLGTVAQAAGEKVVDLYDGAAPGSENWKHSEQEVKTLPGWPRMIFNVAKPTLTVFQPEPGKANGTAVVICPGGGFFMLSIDSEGYEVARYLAAKGVTCFVLKYRLLPCETDNPLTEALSGGDYLEKVAPIIKLALADGLAAMAHVRTHAKDYGVNPGRIGIMGFSAGGTLAASVAYSYTAETRPDFVAPVYPAHDLAIKGDGVRSDAPPLFVAAATDDQLGLAPESVAMYQAWTAAGKPAELHMYAKGGHGFGMNKQNLPCDTWADRLADWLRMQGLLENAPSETGTASASRPDPVESPRPTSGDSDEVIYGRKDGMALTMIVQPPTGAPNGKGIIFVISAAWHSDINWIDLLRMPLMPISERGYTIFYVLHGSQPKYSIPDAASDLKRAIRFIRYHAADYKIDPDHLGICGASAGGHLSLLMGTTGDDDNAQAKDPVDRVSARVQAVACFYPPTDLLNWSSEGDIEPFKTVMHFTRLNSDTKRYEYVTDPNRRMELGRSVSSCYFVTPDDAPALIAHGDSDKVVPLYQSRRIIEKLREAGVPCELKIKTGGDHGVWGDMAMYVRLFADWFDKYLMKDDESGSKG